MEYKINSCTRFGIVVPLRCVTPALSSATSQHKSRAARRQESSPSYSILATDALIASGHHHSLTASSTTATLLWFTASRTSLVLRVRAENGHNLVNGQALCRIQRPRIIKVFCVLWFRPPSESPTEILGPI